MCSFWCSRTVLIFFLNILRAFTEYGITFGVLKLFLNLFLNNSRTFLVDGTFFAGVLELFLNYYFFNILRAFLEYGVVSSVLNCS